MNDLLAEINPISARLITERTGYESQLIPVTSYVVVSVIEAFLRYPAAIDVITDAITANAICPGVIETELGNSLTRARGAELAEGISLERLGTPQDVANVVAFLATAEPSFMTGQNLVIDGFQWVV